MKLNRNYITPFISLVFLVVGISGFLMLFHLFDGYTEVVHEILGLFFIICTIFHIILNWKALRIYFKKGVFFPALLGVLVLSVILIISERMSPPIDLIIFNKMVKAPINDAFRALDVNYEKASEKLKENGLSIEEATTIEDIWINNDSNPEKVIDLIME
ncbi:DUF4405 domain-containing protein [Sphingobacterium kitahiroshimense]|uniref:DUF4405 domain-containing protein n=1 Tax=Sphingobacterium sp. B16(2022) TaxID=2914044 RepID=UPI00143BEB60|nr:DUF4405 domain-containing protein [Sphingobacterium sp. B16(2022)]NJI71930.1 DUF4405 domain-containing protein [Sphingobacterium sp. B16(2022)]